MLREQPTAQLRRQWTAVFDQYKDKLRPNRRTGQELAAHLAANYGLTAFADARATAAVSESVLKNEWFRQKLPPGEGPRPVTLWGKHNGRRVVVGVDLASGAYWVEDDEDLWDEPCAFQGLDEADLQSCCCVYESVSCLKKRGRAPAAGSPLA